MRLNWEKILVVLLEQPRKARVTRSLLSVESNMAEALPQLWLMTEVEQTTETVEVRRGERSGDDIGGGYGVPRMTEQVKTIVRQRVPLDALALKTQMQGLLQVVSAVFDQAAHQAGLQMEEVELAVEISAQGQVSLLGNGGSLNDKGSIKLKFKRVTPQG